MEVKKILILFLFISSGIVYYGITEPRFENLDSKVLRIVDGDIIYIWDEKGLLVFERY